MKYIQMKFNYDTEDYPTHIEVPEDYWVCSHNIEYTLHENKNK